MACQQPAKKFPTDTKNMLFKSTSIDDGRWSLITNLKSGKFFEYVDKKSDLTRLKPIRDENCYVDYVKLCDDNVKVLAFSMGVRFLGIFDKMTEAEVNQYSEDTLPTSLVSATTKLDGVAWKLVEDKMQRNNKRVETPKEAELWENYQENLIYWKKRLSKDYNIKFKVLEKDEDEEEESPEKEDMADEKDTSGKTVAQLKASAKSIGLKNYSSLNKADLINLINNGQRAEPEAMDVESSDKESSEEEEEEEAMDVESSDKESSEEEEEEESADDDDENVESSDKESSEEEEEEEAADDDEEMDDERDTTLWKLRRRFNFISSLSVPPVNEAKKFRWCRYCSTQFSMDLTQSKKAHKEQIRQHFRRNDACQTKFDEDLRSLENEDDLNTPEEDFVMSEEEN